MAQLVPVSSGPTPLLFRTGSVLRNFIYFVFSAVSVVPNLGIYTDADVSTRSRATKTWRDNRCLLRDPVLATEYSSLSSALRSTVTGFVSLSAAVGLC